MSRPPHTDPRLIAVVAAGGAVGTAGRDALGRLLPASGGLPAATLSVNLAAALALGFLLEALVSARDESRQRRVLRLGLGTGMLGGLSTYSSLALEVQEMLARGRIAPALAYGSGSVVGGAVVCFLGILVAVRLRGGRAQLIPSRADRADGGPADDDPDEVDR